jgi:hypothetical protein
MKVSSHRPLFLLQSQRTPKKDQMPWISQAGMRVKLDECRAGLGGGHLYIEEQFLCVHMYVWTTKPALRP